jgi:hypothetical protein
MVCVALSWVIMSLLGCLPFYLSGQIPRYIDALFEIVSGFTTTGSSIVPNVEGLSRGILYWRSFSHWLGGMGVLVFLLAVVPVSAAATTASPCTCCGRRAPAQRGQAGAPNEADGVHPLPALHPADAAEHPFPAAGADAPVRRRVHGLRHRRHRRLRHQERQHRRLQPVPAERLHRVHDAVRRQFQLLLPAAAPPVPGASSGTRSCGCTSASPRAARC